MNVEQNTGNTRPLSPEEQALQDAAKLRQQLIDSNQAVDDWWKSMHGGDGPAQDALPERPVAVLSLAKRADRGLLADDPDWLPGQDELPLDDVLWLEHPTDTERRAALGAFLQLAVKTGGLAVRLHTLTVMGESGYLSDVELIPREAYRQWRAQCPASLLSELTQIQKWLGEQPASFSMSVSEIPPEPVTLGGAAEKEAALLALLDEVDKRAAEQDAGFNRHSLPGTRAEFRELLNAYCPAFKYIQLGKYTKGKCKFQHGVQPEHGKGAAIWALFPEYPLKLG